MKTKQITELAIRRHDLDASHFQSTYSEKNNTNLNSQEQVFLKGRGLVLDELAILLDKLPKGSKVLDVGCGTAHLTNWIRERGFDVYGVEPSTGMFNFAVSNFPDIEIKQGISSDIPYPDQQFDLIVAFEVLRYLDKAENRNSFKEFHRVLKTGGQLFFTQVNLFSTDFYYLFHPVKSLVFKILSRPHHHCNFTTPKEQEKEMTNAGFREVTTVGRFMGSTRLAFKLGAAVGNLYDALMKTMFGAQRFVHSFYKNFSAHLVVIARKGA